MRPIGFVWIGIWCILLSACTSTSSVREGDVPQTLLQQAIHVRTTKSQSTDAAHPILFSFEGESDKDRLAELRAREEIPRLRIPVFPFESRPRR
jgi:hypothetical protein